MALYAIGDLHLSFQVNKPMEVFDDIWKNYVQKIKDNWEKIVKPEDTVVVTGDVSWGGKLSEAVEDLEFIAELPGRKILLRGNHCHYWKVSKTKMLNDMYEGKLLFLQNNFYTYKDYALIGTKGNFLEYENVDPEKVKLEFDREVRRLRTSFDAAKEAGFEKMIMFLHMPPTNMKQQEGVFTELAKEMGVEQVVYSHLHGGKYDYSIKGYFDGIKYSLVSADYINFVPQRILD